MSEQLEAALAYARLGWHVLPLHSTDTAGHCTCGASTCTSPGKHPRTRNGLKDAACDEETVRAFWARWPTANIGIATEASGLAVVDVDVHNGVDGYESWHGIVNRFGSEIENTLTVDTPSGGQHVYYRANGHDLKSSTGAVAPGIDTRAVGGYVLAPGSSIRDVPYTFAEGHDLLALADLPDALAAILPKVTDPAPGLVKATAADVGTIPSGQRNTTLTSIAGAMRRHGVSEEAMAAALAVEGRRSGLAEAEAVGIARSVARYEPAREAFKLTEIGNAERLAARHGSRVAAVRGRGLMGYAPARGFFTGEHAVLVRYAKDTVRAIYAEAAECPDENTRKALADHARRSETKRSLDAMLALAESEESLERDAADFDADPDLLNVRNGVVDLRTGELHPHSPDFRMTKVAGANYVPGAGCPTWLQHLDRIFEGDEQMLAFMRRVYGYALTGRAGEQVFMVWYGGGANGKGATINAECEAAGDYAQSAQVSTFTPHRSDAIRNDLARLAGARLVTTSETRHRQTLDTPIIKQLTGNDPITARFLYQDEFTYVPQFLIVMSTNHKPHIEAPDFAIKRRVLLVPFDVTIPEGQRDPEFPGKLRAELDGILTWGVKGARDYLANGLGVPEKVRAASEQYREEMDPLFGFQEACTFDPTAWISAADIRAAVEQWCREEGAKEPDGRELADFLKRFGCARERRHHGRGWRGVRCEGFDASGGRDA